MDPVIMLHYDWCEAKLTFLILISIMVHRRLCLKNGISMFQRKVRNLRKLRSVLDFHIQTHHGTQQT